MKSIKLLTFVKTVGAPTVPHGVMPHETIPISVSPWIIGLPLSPLQAPVLSFNGPVQKFEASSNGSEEPSNLIRAFSQELRVITFKVLVCNISGIDGVPFVDVEPQPEMIPSPAGVVLDALGRLIFFTASLNVNFLLICIKAISFGLILLKFKLSQVNLRWSPISNIVIDCIYKVNDLSKKSKNYPWNSGCITIFVTECTWALVSLNCRMPATIRYFDAVAEAQWAAVTIHFSWIIEPPQ